MDVLLAIVECIWLLSWYLYHTTWFDPQTCLVPVRLAWSWGNLLSIECIYYSVLHRTCAFAWLSSPQFFGTNWLWAYSWKSRARLDRRTVSGGWGCGGWGLLEAARELWDDIIIDLSMPHFCRNLLSSAHMSCPFYVHRLYKFCTNCHEDFSICLCLLVCTCLQYLSACLPIHQSIHPSIHPSF